MTICFMAIFYAVLEDRLRPVITLASFDMDNARIDFYDNASIYLVYHYGWVMFGYTLLALGFYSVIYWAYFDDLRIYLIVQFYLGNVEVFYLYNRNITQLQEKRY